MKRRLVEFLVLAVLSITVALGSGPVGAAIWQWSTTAASNDSADPSINWREGMAPSSVNDSARAMMAAVALWRNDTGGGLTSAGTTTALTLATSSNFPNIAALTNQQITFIAAFSGASNGAGVTLNVDGTGATAIFVDGVTGPVPAGTIIAGGVYTVSYVSGGYRLHSSYGSAFNIPLGGILWSTVGTAPNSNFVPPYGQCISTTTYANYWVAMGSPASGGCPGGQFAILDHRGRAPVALDTLPGSSAAGVLTSSSTGCGTAMTAVGAVCANGVQGSAISLAQAPVGIAVSISGSVTTSNLVSSDSPTAAFSTSTSGGTVWRAFSNGSTQTVTGSVGVSGTGISTNTSGAVRPQVMPVVGLIPYLRIL